MSDTPETDAAVNASGGDWSPVLRAVAQRLERERDEALMDRGNGDIATMTRNHYERILRERDEAREEAHKLSGAYEDATNYYARMIELIDERDKLQEELKR